MTIYCIVCKKEPTPKDNFRSFHKFPDNEKLREQWMKAVGIPSITKNTKICSDHFNAKDFHEISEYTRVRRLLSTAVPFSIEALRDVTNTLQEQKQKRKLSASAPKVNSADKKKSDISELLVYPDINNSNDLPHHEEELKLNKNDKNFKRSQAPIDISNIPVTKKFRFIDGYQSTHLSREDFSSDEAWTRFLKYTVFKDRQLEASRKKSQRKDRKIENMNEIIVKSREANADSAADYLQGLPEHVKELISRIRNKKSSSPFPSHLQSFARSLHYHSPAAYDMVRKSFMKCLPCVETLRRWTCSRNYKPGISEEITNHVAEMVKMELENGKHLIFNLTFDEMGIKEWAHYCQRSKEWKGFVDYAGQFHEVDANEKPEKTKKSLVFMLVAINSGFRTPAVYYLTNSLTGEGKCILLKDLLIRLHESNINVVNVTLDGDESNARACKLLGANFDYTDKDNFRPFFLHPATNEIVHVFFDPCHMLKLIRNYLALKGPIFYDNKETIHWKYIKHLNEKAI